MVTSSMVLVASAAGLQLSKVDDVNAANAADSSVSMLTSVVELSQSTRRMSRLHYGRTLFTL
jgi:hypothetical protein